MASFQFEVIEVSFPVCWTYFPCLAILFDLLSFSVQKWGVLYRSLQHGVYFGIKYMKNFSFCHLFLLGFRAF